MEATTFVIRLFISDKDSVWNGTILCSLRNPTRSRAWI